MKLQAETSYFPGNLWGSTGFTQRSHRRTHEGDEYIEVWKGWRVPFLPLAIYLYSHLEESD